MVNGHKHCWDLDDGTFNKFIDDDKYSLLYRDNFTQPIQILLSEKRKSFSEFFTAFLKSTLNIEHFIKNVTFMADVFPKLLSPKKMIT